MRRREKFERNCVTFVLAWRCRRRFKSGCALSFKSPPSITSDLRWNDHVATVLKKVAPALNLTLTLACRHQLPPKVIRKFFVAFVRPRMEYCIAVWCGTSAGSLKLLEPLLTHNVGNRDRRCSLSATFRRLRGGGESIVFVSYTNCTMAKGHRR